LETHKIKVSKDIVVLGIKFLMIIWYPFICCRIHLYFVELCVIVIQFVFFLIKVFNKQGLDRTIATSLLVLSWKMDNSLKTFKNLKHEVLWILKFFKNLELVVSIFQSFKKIATRCFMILIFFQKNQTNDFWIYGL
jgi:hypothetical protein